MTTFMRHKMLMAVRAFQLLLNYCQENLFVESWYIYIYIYIYSICSVYIYTLHTLYIYIYIYICTHIHTTFQEKLKYFPVFYFGDISRNIWNFCCISVFYAFIPRFLTEPLKMFRGTLIGTHLCRVREALERRWASMAICDEIMNCSGCEEWNM